MRRVAVTISESKSHLSTASHRDQGFSKSLLLRTCMVQILLCVQGFVAARAWSLPRPTARRTLSEVCRSGSHLFLASDDDDINNEERRRPRTGWTHNQPKEWIEEDIQAAGGFVDRPREEPLSTLKENEEPRTGWLHNQAAPKSATTEQSSTTESSSSSTVSSARRLLEQAMKQKEQNHRILCPPAFHACGMGRQVVVTEHMISVPIYRSAQQKTPRLDLYFAIVERVGSDEAREFFTNLQTMSPQLRAQAYVQRANLESAEDMILYLQGGPGFGAPTPITSLGLGKGSSWAAKALDCYSRIVLMDQRGTGRSTPITKQTLEKRFPDLFVMDDPGILPQLKAKALESPPAVEKDNEDPQDMLSPSNSTLSQMEEIDSLLDSLLDEEDGDKTPDRPYASETKVLQHAIEEATNFMAQFRADNIVRDAEEIRDALLRPAEDDEEPRPWGAALGQSFGGFCLMTYLSQIEHPPKICLFTGGIAPMLTPVYQVYSCLWDRVQERSLSYYDMYPGDVAVVKTIVRKLLEEPATLPSGGKLTARRFLQLGLGLGGTPSSFAALHERLSSAFVNDDDLEFTRAFLKGMDVAQSFDDHPIYYWLHESIYADGPRESPTNWAAHRAYEDRLKLQSEFDYKITCRLQSDSRPTLFFGEMVFPWMPEDYAELGGLGLTALANALATKTDWGPLFDANHMRQVLADGRCKAAAAVYYDDLYVDFDACMKVVARGGPLEKAKVWISNEYQHSGLRDDGANIFSKLYAMAYGSLRIPS